MVLHTMKTVVVLTFDLLQLVQFELMDGELENVDRE